MKLSKARIQNYRSILDTGEFEIDVGKTILVGPNEAGKTAILQALQNINPPAGTTPFNSLRDYPRSMYSDITNKKVDPAHVPVVSGVFTLEDEDRFAIRRIHARRKLLFYPFSKQRTEDDLIGVPNIPAYVEIKDELARLAKQADARIPSETGGATVLHSESLRKIADKLDEISPIPLEVAVQLSSWLDAVNVVMVGNKKDETSLLGKLWKLVGLSPRSIIALEVLRKQLPVFVLYSNYFRIRPLIHLGHLATANQ